MKRLVALGCLVLTAWCGAAPATSTEACSRLAADLDRAQEARRQAVEKGDNAWKTVLPFAVIARKASSRAAVDDADKQIASLRKQADAEGCDAR